MTMTIYLVDEDQLPLGAYVAELKIRGHQVKGLSNAREALRELRGIRAHDVDLVLVDVMLEPGAMASAGNLQRDTAGLDLLRDLCRQNRDVFPHRAVLFTASTGVMLEMAFECAGELGVELWEKSSFLSPVEFGDRVERMIAARPDGS
jgi:CheY-like chemotaxis protein